MTCSPATRDGALLNLMNTTPDGDFQTYRAESGAFVRDHFFGGDPRAKELVKDMTDDQIWALKRGGHDYRKVYAAYKAATEHKGKPTVILAKTIKGYGLGTHFEARNATHQMKKLRCDGPQGASATRSTSRSRTSSSRRTRTARRTTTPARTTPRSSTCIERRRALGGFVPERRDEPRARRAARSRQAYDAGQGGSGKQEVATTMAFVRLLKDLIRDKDFGHRIVPIIPDEARTFGMDSFFPTAKIYNPHGQHYLSVDRELLLAYKESSPGPDHAHGHQRGRRGGRVHRPSGTSYATHGEPLVPVYVFYSMFGFQRTGDPFWAAGDQMTRGFIIGATAGRTTLTGEGLQHADGHSPILASTNPAVVTYDPAFGYEIGHIVRDGLERMYGGAGTDRPERHVLPHGLQRAHPPAGRARERRRRRRARRHPPGVGVGRGQGPRARSSPPASSVPWALEAQRILAEDWGVSADVWSVTSWTELRRDGLAAEEEAFLNPGQPARVPFVTRQLAGATGPDRRGHRLHEGRPGPDPPVPAERVRLARRGRLRLLRHPRRGPPLLQERHPLHRREDSAVARGEGRRRGGRAVVRHGPLQAPGRQRRRPPAARAATPETIECAVDGSVPPAKSSSRSNAGV